MESQSTISNGVTTTGTGPVNRQKRDIGRKVKKSKVTELGFPIITRGKKLKGRD